MCQISTATGTPGGPSNIALLRTRATRSLRLIRIPTHAAAATTTVMRNLVNTVGPASAAAASTWRKRPSSRRTVLLGATTRIPLATSSTTSAHWSATLPSSPSTPCKPSRRVPSAWRQMASLTSRYGLIMRSWGASASTWRTSSFTPSSTRTCATLRNSFI